MVRAADAMARGNGRERQLSDRERTIRSRNRALLGVLLGLVLLFYVIAIVRMTGG